MRLLNNTLSARYFFSWLLIATVQIIAFPLIYNFTTTWYTARYAHSHTDVFWRVGVEYRFILYAIIIGLQMICIVLLNVKRWIIISAATIALLLILPNLSDRPYRAFQMFAIGALLLWLPYIGYLLFTRKHGQP